MVTPAPNTVMRLAASPGTPSEPGPADVVPIAFLGRTSTLELQDPRASLRYKLLPRKRDTNMDAIALQIVGERFKAPVAVAADHTFTLARLQTALDEDAIVRSERKAQSMTWRAEIRTPGLPLDTRRLGDLRLECHVGIQAGLVSRYPSLIGRQLSLPVVERGP